MIRTKIAKHCFAGMYVTKILSVTNVSECKIPVGESYGQIRVQFTIEGIRHPMNSLLLVHIDSLDAHDTIARGTAIVQYDYKTEIVIDLPAAWTSVREKQIIPVMCMNVKYNIGDPTIKLLCQPFDSKIRHPVYEPIYDIHHNPIVKARLAEVQRKVIAIEEEYSRIPADKNRLLEFIGEKLFAIVPGSPRHPNISIDNILVKKPRYVSRNASTNLHEPKASVLSGEIDGSVKLSVDVILIDLWSDYIECKTALINYINCLQTDDDIKRHKNIWSILVSLRTAS